MAASLARFAFRASLLRAPTTLRPAIVAVRIPCRTISMTEKKKDSSIGLSVPQDGVSTKIGGTINTDYEKRKDWLSYGMDFEDEDTDRWLYYSAFIIAITLSSVLVAWYITYIPNPCWPNRDWVVREAYLELHRREKFGLPLIDPDFVPRENIMLPSEEELEGFEVII